MKSKAALSYHTIKSEAIGQVLEWVRVLGHWNAEDRYAGSGVKAHYLVVAYNTNYSHEANFQGSDIEFSIIRGDTGEDAVSDCRLVVTHAKAIDIAISQEGPLHLLAELPKGTTT